MASLESIRQEAALNFKTGLIEKALELYEEGIRKIVHHEFQDVLDNELSIMYSNAAQCALRLQRWEDAKLFATQSLESFPTNVKALYRRAVAYEKLGQLREAVENTKRALSVDPSNDTAREALERQQSLLGKQCDAELTQQLPETAISNLEATLRGFLNINVNDPLTTTIQHIPTYEDCCTIDDALRVLRRWIVTNKKRELFLAGKAIVFITGFLSSITSSVKKHPSSVDGRDDGTFEKVHCLSVAQHFKNKFLLFILMSILKTLGCFVVDMNNDDTANEQEDIQKKILHFHSPLQIDQDIQKTRQQLRTAVPETLVVSVIKQCIWCGIGPCQIIQDDTTKTQLADDSVFPFNNVRTTCVIFALHFLRYASSMGVVETLDALCCAINCNESELIMLCGLKSVAYLSDCHRRLGLRVLPIKKSQSLMKLLEILFPLIMDSSEDVQRPAQITLSTLFALLSDKDGSEDGATVIQSYAHQLFDAYAPHNGNTSEIYHRNCIVFKFISLLSVVNNEVALTTIMGIDDVDNLLINRVFCPVYGYPQLQVLALEVLTVYIKCSSFRQTLLRTIQLERIQDELCKPTNKDRDPSLKIRFLVLVSRLCVYENQVREMLFHNVAVVEVTREALLSLIDTTKKATPKMSIEVVRSIFEFFFFLTLHGVFKQKLMKSVEKDSASVTGNNHDILFLFTVALDTAAEFKDTLCCFFYLYGICNLLQSREFKDRIRRRPSPGGLQLDHDQLVALEEFYEKLPDQCKPSDSFVKFDRGSEEMTDRICSALLDLDIPQKIVGIPLWTSPAPSLNILCAWVDVLALFCHQQKNRVKIMKIRCIAGLLETSHKLMEDTTDMYKEDLSKCRQVLAQVCIAANPTTFSYKDTLSILSQLIPLLSHSYELYVYEATLAITNLISQSAEARDSLYFQKGMYYLVDVATSDNPMCRAAGVEALCNMAMCDVFREKIVQGKHDVELKLLLAFLTEHENQRAFVAAAGCLAMLMSDQQVGLRVLGISNVTNILTVTTEPLYWEDNKDFQIRLLTVIDHINELCSLQHNQDDNLTRSAAEVQLPARAKELCDKLIKGLREHWQRRLPTLCSPAREIYSKLVAHSKSIAP